MIIHSRKAIRRAVQPKAEPAPKVKPTGKKKVYREVKKQTEEKLGE